MSKILTDMELEKLISDLKLILNEPEKIKDPSFNIQIEIDLELEKLESELEAILLTL